MGAIEDAYAEAMAKRKATKKKTATPSPIEVAFDAAVKKRQSRVVEPAPKRLGKPTTSASSWVEALKTPDPLALEKNIDKVMSRETTNKIRADKAPAPKKPTFAQSLQSAGADEKKVEDVAKKYKLNPVEIAWEPGTQDAVRDAGMETSQDMDDRPGPVVIGSGLSIGRDLKAGTLRAAQAAIDATDIVSKGFGDIARNLAPGAAEQRFAELTGERTRDEDSRAGKLARGMGELLPDALVAIVSGGTSTAAKTIAKEGLKAHLKQTLSKQGIKTALAEAATVPGAINNAKGLYKGAVLGKASATATHALAGNELTGMAMSVDEQAHYLKQAAARGWLLAESKHQVQQGNLLRVAEIAKAQEKLEGTESYQAMNSAEGFAASWAALKADPARIIAQWITESGVMMAPGMPGMAAGGLLGKAGVAGAAGYTSGAIETASAILDGYRAEGVDITDPKQLKAAFEDKELYNRIANKARIRGAVIGTFDATSVMMAGMLFPNAKSIIGKIAAGAGEAIVQGGMGATGEAAGSIATGEAVSIPAMFAEFFAEIGQSPGEVGMAMWAQSRADAKAGKIEEAAINAQLAQYFESMEDPVARAVDYWEQSKAGLSEDGRRVVEEAEQQLIAEGYIQAPASVVAETDVAAGMGEETTTDPSILAGKEQLFRELDEALKDGRTDVGTHAVARLLIERDDTINDANLTINISAAARRATAEMLEHSGIIPETDPTTGKVASYAVLGETYYQLSSDIARTAIGLWNGHTARDAVHEFYHRAWNLLAEAANPMYDGDAIEAYQAYHDASGDTRPIEEHFAEEGMQAFFSDKLHEQGGPIRKLFATARRVLTSLIDELRNYRTGREEGTIPQHIDELYQRVGRGMLEQRRTRPGFAKAFDEMEAQYLKADTNEARRGELRQEAEAIVSGARADLADLQGQEAEINRRVEQWDSLDEEGKAQLTKDWDTYHNQVFEHENFIERAESSRVARDTMEGVEEDYQRGAVDAASVEGMRELFAGVDSLRPTKGTDGRTGYSVTSLLEQMRPGADRETYDSLRETLRNLIAAEGPGRRRGQFDTFGQLDGDMMTRAEAEALRRATGGAFKLYAGSANAKQNYSIRKSEQPEPTPQKPTNSSPRRSLKEELDELARQKGQPVPQASQASTMTAPVTRNRRLRTAQDAATEPPNVTVAGNSRPPSGPPVSEREVVKVLVDAVGILYRQGRMGPTKAAAFFKPGLGIGRAKNMYDIPTAAHEVGHALGYRYAWHDNDGLLSELGRFADNNELGRQSSWEEGEDQAKKLREGIAEYVRYYIVDPRSARTEAPEFTQLFESALADNGLLAKFIQAQELYRNYLDQGGVNKLRGAVDYNNKVAETVEKQPRWYGARTDLVDDLFAQRKILEFQHGKRYEDVEPSRNYYMKSRLSRGASAIAEELITNGTDGVTGLKGIIQRSRDKSDGAQDFQDYAIARRLQALSAEDRATGVMTDSEIEEVIKAYDSPDFQQAFDELQSYYAHLLDVEKEFLTPEAREKMAQLPYVPLKRVVEAGIGETVERGGTGSNKGIANKSQTYHRYKGTSHALYQPWLDTTIERTYTSVQRAMQNDAMLTFVDEVSNDPRTAREAERVPITSLPVEIGQMFKDAISKMSDGESILEHLPDEIFDLKYWKQLGLTAKMKNARIVFVMREGKPEFYQIRDKILYDSLVAIPTKAQQLVVKILGAPAHSLRTAVTADPGFLFYTNLVRDSLHSMMVTDGFIPFWDTAASFKEAVAGGNAKTELTMAGGAMAGTAALDRSKVRKKSRNIAKAATAPDAISAAAEALVEGLRNVRDSSEMVNRIAVYKRELETVKRKHPEWSDADHRTYAAFRSRDLLDFAMRGRLTAEVTQTIAFARSMINGIAKTRHEAARNPARVAIAGAALSVATAILYALNRDDDDYNVIGPWERNNYWHIRMPDSREFVRIPKPHEWGLLFGTSIESTLRMIDGDDRAWAAYPDAAKSLLMMDMPNGLQIAIDLAGNTQSHSGAPIVPEYLESGPSKVRPEDQYTGSTSPAFKRMGKALGRSPAKMQYAAKQMMGPLGDVAIAAIDWAAYPLTKEKPTKKLNVLRRVATQINAYPEAYDRLRVMEREARQDLNSVRNKDAAQRDAYAAELGYGDFKSLKDRASTLRDGVEDMRDYQDAFYAEDATPDRQYEARDAMQAHAVNVLESVESGSKPKRPKRLGRKPGGASQ